MLRMLALVGGLALVSGPALAQVVKQGNVSGTLLSASGVAPQGGTQGTILNVPAAGAFVLTQVCVAGAPGANNADNAQVVGSTIGNIALQYGDGVLGSCTVFTPGLSIPAGEELRCVQLGASSSAVTCTVTGVVSKK
jgi:hypothetical protein